MKSIHYIRHIVFSQEAYRHLAWLDIGCGTGKMAEAAFKALDIEDFLFCDSSEGMIEIAKERFAGEKSKFVTSSFLELNEFGPFDVVTAIGISLFFKRRSKKGPSKML